MGLPFGVTFNQTNVELKYYFAKKTIEENQAFNQTNVELKLRIH